MKTRFLFLAAALFAAMTFAACGPVNPGDDEGPDDGGKTGKMIAKITSVEEEGIFTCDYDDEGRIVKLNAYDLEINYEYSSGAVIISSLDSDYTATATLTDGKITDVTEEGDEPDGVDDYTYNGNRLATSAGSTLTWTNGNVTQRTFLNGNNESTTISYEYSSHANDASLDLNNCPFSMYLGANDSFLAWLDLFGERCKNLVSKYTVEDQPDGEEPFTSQVEEYDYTVDKNGRVTKIVVTTKNYEQDGSLESQSTDTIEITYK